MDFRPAVPEDFTALCGELPQFRCKCTTATKHGKPIAIGGLVYRPEGVFASVKLTDEIRQHPMALHRAVKRGLEAAARAGIREIFADTEVGNPAAAPWLQRLGFEQRQTRAGSIWVWRNKGKENQCRAG